MAPSITQLNTKLNPQTAISRKKEREKGREKERKKERKKERNDQEGIRKKKCRFFFPTFTPNPALSFNLALMCRFLITTIVMQFFGLR